MTQLPDSQSTESLSGSVKLNLTDRQLRLVKALHNNSYQDWESLNYESKLVLASIPYDLDGIVDPQKVKRFRLQREIEKTDSIGAKVKLRARLTAFNARTQLTD